MIEILREFNIAYEGDLDFSREIIFVDLTKVVKVIKVAKVVKGGGGGHFLRLTQNWMINDLRHRKTLKKINK